MSKKQKTHNNGGLKRLQNNQKKNLNHLTKQKGML
jgi:hypothetical protein